MKMGRADLHSRGKLKSAWQVINTGADQIIQNLDDATIFKP